MSASERARVTDARARRAFHQATPGVAGPARGPSPVSSKERKAIANPCAWTIRGV